MKTIQIRVKPKSAVSSLEPADDGTWVARLRSPPTDGKANEELIGLIAKQFGCRRVDVEIATGASSRIKLVKVLR